MAFILSSSFSVWYGLFQCLEAPYHPHPHTHPSHAPTNQLSPCVCLWRSASDERWRSPPQRCVPASACVWCHCLVGVTSSPGPVNKRCPLLLPLLPSPCLQNTPDAMFHFWLVHNRLCTDISGNTEMYYSSSFSWMATMSKYSDVKLICSCLNLEEAVPATVRSKLTGTTW